MRSTALVGFVLTIAVIMTVGLHDVTGQEEAAFSTPASAPSRSSRPSPLPGGAKSAKPPSAPKPGEKPGEKPESTWTLSSPDET